MCLLTPGRMPSGSVFPLLGGSSYAQVVEVSFHRQVQGSGVEDASPERQGRVSWWHPALMPCAHPIPAARCLDGSVVISRSREVREFSSPDDVLSSSSLLLPCGSCVGCRLSRAREWAIRNSLEFVRHRDSCFVTLTFSDAKLPPSLDKSHLQWFFKRLRKRMPPSSLRFFACGEYGERFGRPHYHALLYGTSDASLVERAWDGGFATIDAITPGRISYAAGYCAKKVGLLDEARDVTEVDYSTGEVLREFRYQPPFIQMSRRPGIGGHSRVHWRSWRRTAYWNSLQVPVPRYLHRSYAETASESELADLEREKLEARMVPTIRELDAFEVITSKRISLNAERRVFQ